MSTFRTAAQGVAWLGVVQVILVVGQIAIGAVTARIFAPEVFGGFFAAIALEGLLVLIAGTGMASFVLKETRLRAAQLRGIRIATLVAAVSAGVAYALLAPLWLTWLKSPSGAVFIPFVTATTIVAPLAALESALLRREGRNRADAIIIGTAFVLANGTMVALAMAFREPWALAVGIAIQPFVIWSLSFALRRERYRARGVAPLVEWAPYAARVTAQNLAYMALFATPGIAIGAGAGASELGQYSRANSATQMSGSALTTALVRAVEPHWRKLTDRIAAAHAASDAAVLAGSAGFTTFGLLAALGTPLMALWLGPGWLSAGEFVSWLAIGVACSPSFVILSNFLEMRGELRRVRPAQIAMGIGLAAGIAGYVWSSEIRMVFAGFILSQVLGLLVVSIGVDASGSVHRLRTIKRMLLPLAWAVATVFAALGGSMGALAANWKVAGSGELAQVVAGTAVAMIVLGAGFRWHPARAILSRRGTSIRPEKPSAGEM